MSCIKCGHEIMDEAIFCSYCGEKAAQGAPESGRLSIRRHIQIMTLTEYRNGGRLAS